MIIPENIQLVNQRDDYSCGLACVAMVSGFDLDHVEEAVQFLKIPVPLSLDNLMRLIVHYSILPRPMLSCDPLYLGEIYILSVLSLNVERGIHLIVYDARSGSDGCERVYDPQEGNPGKRFYSASSYIRYSDPIKLVNV